VDIPIALNTCGVHAECKEDLTGSLARIAEMGYEGVEFYGYYGRSAEELRQLLDDVGLRAGGVHIGSGAIGIGTWRSDLAESNLQQTVEFHQTLGNKYLIVSWVDRDEMQSRDSWLGFAGQLNEGARRLRPYGIQVGYHCDGWEFEPVDGEAPWDTLAANTDEDVILQVDTMNFAEYGSDPIHWLEKYAHRAFTVHLVEFTKRTPYVLIGDGDVSWADVFRICEGTGSKTEWYVIEQERCPCPPMEAAEQSLANLRRLAQLSRGG